MSSAVHRFSGCCHGGRCFTHEARCRQGHIRAAPGFVESFFDPGGLFFFALRVQALHQTKQRPAIFSIQAQILPVDGFSLGGPGPCITRERYGSRQANLKTMMN